MTDDVQGSSEAWRWLEGQRARVQALLVGGGDLDPRWSSFGDRLETTVCDPLADPADASDRVVTAAVSPYPGPRELRVTRRRSLSSLLEPNKQVVSRHSTAGDYEVVERRMVPTISMESLAQRGSYDYVRMRASGAEYQLLSAGLPVLAAAVCVEVDGGLVDNYVGQYPFYVVGPLLRGAGFALAALEVSEGTPFPAWETARSQPTVCRSLWLREVDARPSRRLTLEKAAVLLRICRVLGYHEHGRDVAQHLAERGLLPEPVSWALLATAAWSGQGE